MEHKELKDLTGRDFLREKVRIRDRQTCQMCGKQWKEGTRKFDVHHLDETKEGAFGRNYTDNKDMGKLITYCHKCHLNLHSVRNKMCDGQIPVVYSTWQERDEKILELRKMGMTHQKIAEEMGLERTWVTRLLNHSEHIKSRC